MRRTRSIAVLLLALAVLALPASGAGAAEPTPDLRHLHGLGEVRYNRLESSLLGRGFHLFVSLPKSYSERGQERFPTVYLLDGGTTFPMLAGYARYLTLAGEIPEMILVGISYGTDDWQRGNLRGTDFTAPSQEREHWGGAARFQEVLRSELLPLIEKEYRSDAARRILFGQSLGGQFVLFTALTGPGLFHGHIASNPALHRNLDFFLRGHAVGGGGEGSEERARTVPPMVFVSSAELDDPRFREPAVRWIEHWQARPAAGWQLRVATLEGQNHFSAAPEAFRRGLRWVLGPDGAEPSP